MKTSGMTKTKLFFKNNYKILGLCLLLTLLNIFFLCWSFKTYNLTFGKTFILMVAGTIVLEIILCTIIYFSKKKKWKIEKLFLVLSLIIGIIYVFALPVGRAPDEESHFFRIYEITTGHIIPDTAEDGITRGSTEASNIEIVRDFKENNVKYADVINALSIYPDESDQSFVKNSASGYNPIVYLPHLLGMGIGEGLHLPLLITAYLAKLFNCIACIVILYFCIKYIPLLKEIIFFAAFLPITMQAMTSLSADGFITAIAIAFISFVLYATYSLQKPFTKKHYIVILALCIILSLSKIVYAFLCLLIFAIPKERFGNQKRKLIGIFSIGGICAVILFSWLVLSSSSASSVDPTNQNILFSNPLKFLAILVHSLSTHFYLYFNGMLGGYLEWFNITLSPLYLFPSLVILVLLCKKYHDTYKISPTLRILAIFIFSIISLLTFTGMFTQWTKPGETLIDGVQGRYFLPILLLIPLAFMSSQKSQNSKSSTTVAPLSKSPLNFKQNYYLYCFYIFESVYAITSIACYHL